MKITTVERCDLGHTLVLDCNEEGCGNYHILRKHGGGYYPITVNFPISIKTKKIEDLFIRWMPKDLTAKQDNYRDNLIIEISKELLKTGDGDFEGRLSLVINDIMRVRND